MKTPIQQWINGYAEDKELIYGKGAIEQAMFARDRLAKCVARTYEEYKSCAFVIGEHTGKSVKLPVVLLERPGLSVVTRDNFHNVAISVKRESDIPLINLEALIEKPNKKTALVYCEGFPEEWGFGPFAQSQREFTGHVGNRFEAYVFLRMVGICTP